jgi:hypothetical protein
MISPIQHDIQNASRDERDKTYDHLRQQPFVEPGHTSLVSEDLLDAVPPVLVEDLADDGRSLIL